MMAICHTAVPERAEGKITYQAASPGTAHIQTAGVFMILSVQGVYNNFGVLL